VQSSHFDFSNGRWMEYTW